MLSLIFSLYLTATLAMCFLRIRVGVAMLLAYSILVPYLQIFSFGPNFFFLIVLVSLLSKYNYKKLVFQPLKPFLLLFLFLLIIIPFHYQAPYSFQLKLLRSDFMSTVLLPFVMINIMKNDEKAFDLFYKVLVFSIFIASAYSIFLTTMPGINPYLISTLPLSGREFNEAYALAEDGGRIFGRISGVFVHPMTNGLFLSLALIFVLYQVSVRSVFKDNFQLFLNILVLLCVFSALLVIGIRTAIVSVGIGFLVYMTLEKNIKSAMVGVLIIGSTLLIAQSIPELGDYFSSITDKDSSGIKGSSIEMRINQLNGAVDAIRNNYLFGNGYGWTTYYELTRGSHPVMLSFESLFLVVVCNNGFIGVIFWVIMILMYYFGVRRKLSYQHSNFTLALLSIYITYAMVTGEYGYMKYFLIFYSLMWMQGRKPSQISQRTSKNSFLNKNLSVV